MLSRGNFNLYFNPCSQYWHLIGAIFFCRKSKLNFNLHPTITVLLRGKTLLQHSVSTSHLSFGNTPGQLLTESRRNETAISTVFHHGKWSPVGGVCVCLKALNQMGLCTLNVYSCWITGIVAAMMGCHFGNYAQQHSNSVLITTKWFYFC